MQKRYGVPRDRHAGTWRPSWNCSISAISSTYRPADVARPADAWRYRGRPVARPGDRLPGTTVVGSTSSARPGWEFRVRGKKSAVSQSPDHPRPGRHRGALLAGDGDRSWAGGLRRNAVRPPREPIIPPHPGRRPRRVPPTHHRRRPHRIRAPARASSFPSPPAPRPRPFSPPDRGHLPVGRPRRH